MGSSLGGKTGSVADNLGILVGDTAVELFLDLGNVSESLGLP